MFIKMMNTTKKNSQLNVQDITGGIIVVASDLSVAF
jgi:hypothetical protein